MSKKYLRSNMSESEARFFSMGHGIWGKENSLTNIFKIVGCYVLSQSKNPNVFKDYSPVADNKFEYENAGYTILNQFLKSKYNDINISRKYIKYLSRKWRYTPVIISFSCNLILSALYEYIVQHPDLSAALKKYAEQNRMEWCDLMPIQYDFLSTRSSRGGRNVNKAREIIDRLPDFTF